MKWVKYGSLGLLAVGYVILGAYHFWNPDVYRPMMPAYLPEHDLLIAVSGAAEIALGLAILVPQTRVLAAWGIIALLVAVVPANINVAIYDIPIGNAPQGFGAAVNWGRVAFQPVLMLWAWWHTRPGLIPG